jgi:hypothetical protein
MALLVGQVVVVVKMAQTVRAALAHRVKEMRVAGLGAVFRPVILPLAVGVAQVLLVQIQS